MSPIPPPRRSPRPPGTIGPIPGPISPRVLPIPMPPSPMPPKPMPPMPIPPNPKPYPIGTAVAMAKMAKRATRAYAENKNKKIINSRKLKIKFLLRGG